MVKLLVLLLRNGLIIVIRRIRKWVKNKREKDINGKYIGNAIGYCHSELHPGALNHNLAYKHKCIAKKCKNLEKYSEDSWKIKEKYRNYSR